MLKKAFVAAVTVAVPVGIVYAQPRQSTTCPAVLVGETPPPGCPTAAQQLRDGGWNAQGDPASPPYRPEIQQRRFELLNKYR